MESQEPKITWLNPCKDCPSYWYPPDPEVIGMRSWGQEACEKHSFRCAWRPEGYCMGQAKRRFEHFSPKPPISF